MKAKGKKLTEKEGRFLEAYCKHGEYAKAHSAAGYSGQKASARKLLWGIIENPDKKDEVAEALRAQAMR